MFVAGEKENFSIFACEQALVWIACIIGQLFLYNFSNLQCLPALVLTLGNDIVRSPQRDDRELILRIRELVSTLCRTIECQIQIVAAQDLNIILR